MLLLGVAIAVIGAVLICQSRARALALAERELNSLSIVTMDQADRALQSVDLLLDSVVAEVSEARVATPAEFTSRFAGPATHDALALRVRSMPQVTSVSLVNTDGTVVSNSSLWPAPLVNIRDRDYFQAVAGGADPAGPDPAGPTPTSLVSRPMISRVDGTWCIHVARRLTARDGRFIGIALVAVSLRYFERLYASVAPSPDYAFALFRPDGVLVARYPWAEAQIGQVFSFRAFDPADIGEPPVYQFRVRSAIDGRDRLGLVRAIPHYALRLHVSRSVDAILAFWQERRLLYLAVIAGMELALLSIALLGARQIRVGARLARAEAARGAAEERERDRRDLLTHYARFATVLDNLSQGLCVFDAAQRVVVANRRVAELFALAEPPTRGETPAACLSAIRTSGLLRPRELRLIAAAIRRLVAGQLADRSVWHLTDGRVLAVGFQPIREAGWLLTFDDVTEQRRAAARLAYMAHHDPLTGLANRALFRERLEQATRGAGCAVICLDLDGFKEVNDTLGHAAGDALLQQVAGRLVGCVGDADTVSRLGGDEFAVIRSAALPGDDVTSLAQRIVDELSRPYDIQGNPVVAGVSAGIAVAPQDGSAAETLVKHADIALYTAKQEAGGCCRRFDAAMNATLEARRRLQADVARALPAGELELYYQPLVCLATRRIVGFEALLRWHHPQRGMLLPGQFIPVMEEMGLIARVGEWVLAQACAEAACWPGELKIAVNLSPAQFRQGAIVQAVSAALRASRLAPRRLELELTESALLNDTAETAAAIGTLRHVGAALVMDDFGTGYSSLGYLHRFPFDKVKIDRSFVQDLGLRREAVGIVRALIGLCRHLGMTTLAEGVETEQQMTVLLAEGCREGQGFLFSEPRAAHEVRALLELQGYYRAAEAVG